MFNSNRSSLLIAVIKEKDKEVRHWTELNHDHSWGDVVRGVTVQDVWLLVVFENKSEIQMFNVETLEHRRSIYIGRLQDPWDITASDYDVYISERTRGKIIVRSGNGSSKNGRLMVLISPYPCRGGIA